MLKSIYELIDSKILYGISKMFPSVYRFYTSFYDKFIPYINLIKYKDKHFFIVLLLKYLLTVIENVGIVQM